MKTDSIEVQRPASATHGKGVIERSRRTARG
jgi:hypothetical protein